MTDSDQLRRALVQNLESLRRSGVQSIPRPVSVPSATITSAPVVPSIAPASKPTVVTQAAKPASTGMLIKEQAGFTGSEMATNDRGPALHVLSQEVAQCVLCPELAARRTQTVFGVGNPNARLVFFGEAPGADEDRLGEPFVGKAGQLLTKIIEACQLTREDVYILNVLKCRPPNNRNPTPEEATCCRPFFEKQLEIIRPEVICCLGSIAATTLLETTMPVGRLRGKFHNWRGISVAVTYHPAYLLRNPAAKKTTWADMKMVMKELGVAL